ncbi:patatin-like phospholipase family protein [Xanthovirga aplysinae]|uniref:patatin-like phospholipase family protein n=1 Tax=Xanthovirga aplysinae TaxID=2529853 RepID=UPI0012BBB0D0|nr:patatin-like phospholipase family protein [Xanthovirga aplysinae]MTI31909.1 patatin [Xanthovirga aplysinae]
MKLGLTFSGGGAKGFAFAGILKTLDEHKVKIDILSGSSIGAMVGALYAYGFSPDEMLKIFGKIRLWKYFKPSFKRGGLFSMNLLEGLFRKHLSSDDFSSLEIPLVVTATNVRTGELHYFKEGPLIRPVMASACLPVIFQPVEINGELFMDGGVLENLPVKPIKPICDKVIALHCNPIDKDFREHKLSLRRLMERSLFMAIGCNVNRQIHLCDLFLEPPGLQHYKVFELHKAEELFELGYKFSQKNINHILNLIYGQV